MSALSLLGRLGRSQLRLLQRSPALLSQSRVVPSVTLARIPYARTFSAPATTSQEKKLLHPDDIESIKQLEAGNPAEAYGVSKDAGAIGELGILQKYGVYPIAAAALAIAISKEIIIMNEEVILAGCFLSSALSGYIALREPMLQSFADRRKEVTDLMEGSYNVQIEVQKQRHADAIKYLAVVDEMQAFTDELIAWKKSVYERVPQIAEQQVRNEVAKALIEVKSYQDKVKSNYSKDFVESANAYVKKAIRGADKTTKDAVLDGAIEELRTGKRAKRVGSPQVLALYRQYIKQHQPNWDKIAPKDPFLSVAEANKNNKDFHKVKEIDQAVLEKAFGLKQDAKAAAKH